MNMADMLIIACVPHSIDGKIDHQDTASPIRDEDIVFIKHGASESGLEIKAIGVVKSDFPIDAASKICLPVEWKWLGEKILPDSHEHLSLRGSPFY